MQHNTNSPPPPPLSIDPIDLVQNSGLVPVNGMLVTECCPALIPQQDPEVIPSPPAGPCFVSMVSLMVGASYAGRISTPDSCKIGCNEPKKESTWRFTSSQVVTFNGDNENDLGSIILYSTDSVFVSLGSSFHIFDHKN